MTSRRLLSNPASSSRGAKVLEKEQLATFLNDAYWVTEQCGTLGGLLLVHIEEEGRPLGDPHELEHACHLIAQIARQADAVGWIDESTIAVVLRTVQRRDDTLLMMERILGVLSSSAFGWSLSTGMSVFPLCGPSPSDAWRAARRDLEGALSHDQWEHVVPSETLRAGTAPGGVPW